MVAIVSKENIHFTTKCMLVCLMAYFSCFNQVFAQKKSDPKKEWAERVSNKDYICGEGYGQTLPEAQQAALHNLITKIVVHVTGDVSVSESEVFTDDKLEANTDFKSKVQTYSQATLTNTVQYILKDEPNAHVGCAILRSELDKIFQHRIVKVKDLVQSGLKAENLGKADDVLRNFYWAFSLLKSVQYPNTVTYEENGIKHDLITWLPEKINSVFSDLKVSVTKRVNDDVELWFTYKGKPVNSLDYTYFDGRSWSNIYSAKDGVGVLELVAGNNSDSYRLKYEYEFRGESKIDPEIEAVINTFRGVPFPDAQVTVKSKVDKSSLSNSKHFASNTKPIETFGQMTDNVKPLEKAENVKTVSGNLTTVISALKSRNYSVSSDMFTDRGWDIFQKLVRYGNARVVGEPSVNITNYNGGVVARGMQMSFSFKTGVRKSFVEDVVFYFNNDNKIDNIAFGLGKTAENDILYRGVWPEETRKTIVSFLENYKTAYALKRLDYIDDIFDDDAIIIVGVELKKSQNVTSPNVRSNKNQNNELPSMTVHRDKEHGNTITTNNRNKSNNNNQNSENVVAQSNENVRDIMNDGTRWQKTEDGVATAYSGKGSNIIRYNRHTKDHYLATLKRSFSRNEFINIRFSDNEVLKCGNGGELYAIQIHQDYYSSTYNDKGYLFLEVDFNNPNNPTIILRTWQPDKDPDLKRYFDMGDF